MHKQQARDQAKRARASLSSHDRAALSNRICRNFFAEISLRGVLHLNCFLPIEKQYEPDTLLILRSLQEDQPHISVSVPYMEMGDEEFLPVEWAYGEPLIDGPYGMPLPATFHEINPLLIDLVLVPLMAVNGQGHRIGYGGGYYDRFLSRCRPEVLKVGLSFFEPIQESIDDLHENDIRLNALVTPRGVVHFPR